MQQDGKNPVVIESALIITVVSALFYFWGYAIIALANEFTGVPPQLINPGSVQEYLMLGGVFFLVLISPIVVVLRLLRLLPEKLTTSWQSKIAIKLTGKSPLFWSIIAFYAITLSMAVVLLYAKSVVDLSKPTMYKVKYITTDPDAKIKSKYEGLYFLNMKDDNYVFSNFSSNKPRTYICNKDTVQELVLEAQKSKEDQQLLSLKFWKSKINSLLPL